jgi:hypothetical protein
MSNVGRSVYQKKCEEAKALLADIEALIMNDDILKTIEVHAKWKTHFQKEREFNRVMKLFAQDYLKKNPELDITSPKFKKP